MRFSTLSIVSHAATSHPRTTTLPESVDPDQTAELRLRRERDGEVAAVRALRRKRRELSLVDAVHLVGQL